MRLSGAYRTTPVEALHAAPAFQTMDLQVKTGCYILGRVRKQRKYIKTLHGSSENALDINSKEPVHSRSYGRIQKKRRRLVGVFPRIEDRMSMELEINPFFTGHGRYRHKLHQLTVVEDDMYHTCGMVATSEHKLLICKGTEKLAREERELHGKQPLERFCEQRNQ